MGGPSCSSSSGDKLRILGWVSICGCAKHADRSLPDSHPIPPLAPAVWSPHHASRPSLCQRQGALCLSTRPPTFSADLGGHPPFLKGSVRAPLAGQECWRQLTTLGRPALTGEMVVHLVTFGFFPGVLASFSPHAQGQGSQG